MPVDVLCIGHAAFDLSLFVDSYPVENSKAEIHRWMESGGGPAANAACLISLWGLRCAFAGVLGEDHHGLLIRKEFETVGIDVSLLEIRPGHETPFSVILVNEQNGSRTIVNRKKTAPPLALEAAVARLLAPKVLLFDGHELPAALQALDLFPDAISILDAGSMRAGTCELAGKVDYLAASERFALQAAGMNGLETAAGRRLCLDRLRDLFSTTVIVTLGERGLVVQDDLGFRSMPAFPAPVVDTTGAGDIFHGAFAYAVCQGLPLDHGLQLASMAASLSVRVAGGRKSIPMLPQVEEALAHAF